MSEEGSHTKSMSDTSGSALFHEDTSTGYRSTAEIGRKKTEGIGCIICTTITGGVRYGSMSRNIVRQFKSRKD